MSQLGVGEKEDGGTTGILWVEVKDADKHSQCIVQPLTAKDGPSPVDLKSSNLSSSRRVWI